MGNADELLTVEEVAERLKRNPETIRRWIKSKRLPAVRPAGGPYIIHSTDLDRFLNPEDDSPKAPAPSSPVSEEERREADADLINSWARILKYLQDDLRGLVDNLPSLPDDEEDLAARLDEIRRPLNRFYAYQRAVNVSGASRRMQPYVEALQSRDEYLPNDLHQTITDYLSALKTLNRHLIPEAERWVERAEEILVGLKAPESELPAEFTEQREVPKKK